MSLRRYLLACYGITAVLAALAFAALALSMEGRLPIGPIFEGAALTALANVGINIWPWASRVPEERRTSFWAYRGTNIFLGLVGALILTLAFLTLLGAAG